MSADTTSPSIAASPATNAVPVPLSATAAVADCVLTAEQLAALEIQLANQPREVVEAMYNRILARWAKIDADAAAEDLNAVRKDNS